MPQKKNSKEYELKILMENSVVLQKVVTNISVSLDTLSKQIENLLKLFENSAKSVAEKTVSNELDTKKILQKVDNLSEQNKIIARSLAMMHENAFSNTASATNTLPQISQTNNSLPNQPDFRGYQKSVSSK